MPSQPHIEGKEGWAFDPWLDVPGLEGGLEVIAVQAQPSGFAVVYNDNSHYAGQWPGLAVVSMQAGRFDYQAPMLGGCVSGDAIVDGAALTISCPLSDSWAATLDPGGKLVRAQGAIDDASRQPPSGIERCATLRDARLSDGRRIASQQAGERSIHALVIGEGARLHDYGAPAKLRYVRCDASTGDERVVELSAQARSAALTLDGRGEPLIAYVEQHRERLRLVIARRGSGAPIDHGDVRIASALAACASLRITYGPIPDVAQDRIGVRLDPTELVCATIGRDADVRAQAVAISDAGCDSGDARSCYVSGSLRSQVMERLSFVFHRSGGTIDTSMRKRWLPQDPEKEHDSLAPERFERGCRLGDDDSCTRVLLGQDAAKAAATALAREQCQRGSRFACDLIAAYPSDRE